MIRFTTTLFDVSQERPNDINPIYGESLLLWLAGKLRDHVAIPQPRTEDWGWYVNIDWNGRTYLLGASAADPEPSGEREWVLQIVKHRSVKERLLGRDKMTPEDDCYRCLLQLLQQEPAFVGVTAE